MPPRDSIPAVHPACSATILDFLRFGLLPQEPALNLSPHLEAIDSLTLKEERFFLKLIRAISISIMNQSYTSRGRDNSPDHAPPAKRQATHHSTDYGSSDMVTDETDSANYPGRGTPAQLLNNYGTFARTLVPENGNYFPNQSAHVRPQAPGNAVPTYLRGPPVTHVPQNWAQGTSPDQQRIMQSTPQYYHQYDPQHDPQGPSEHTTLSDGTQPLPLFTHAGIVNSSSQSHSLSGPNANDMPRFDASAMQQAPHNATRNSVALTGDLIDPIEGDIDLDLNIEPLFDNLDTMFGDLTAFPIKAETLRSLRGLMDYYAKAVREKVELRRTLIRAVNQKIANEETARQEKELEIRERETARKEKEMGIREREIALCVKTMDDIAANKTRGNDAKTARLKEVFDAVTRLPLSDDDKIMIR
ncbi:hypothetical protein FRC11_000954, partial [Ceratobasidium sp. 423]